MISTRSIHSRLLLWLIIPLILIASVVSFENYHYAKKTAAELHDQTLLSVMLVIAETIVPSLGDLLPENILEALTQNLGDQFFYHAVGPDNAFVTGYSGVPPYLGDKALSSNEPIFYDSTYQGNDVRVVTIRRFVNDPELSGWMTITAWQSIDQHQGLIYDIFARSVIRLLLLIICAGVIVWLAVTIGLKPLQRLKRSIERRTPDDLSSIKGKGEIPIELKPLVQSMNSLFLQLSKAIQIRERFLGDAAHQLRNPIAAIQAQSDCAIHNQTIEEYQASINKIGAISKTTGTLIEQMLIGAKAHAQNPKSAHIFSPTAIVREAAEEYAYLAMKKNQEYTLELADEPANITGYPTLLSEAVKNLISNAITHNDEKAHITIGQACSSDGKMLRIHVEDDGRGITETEFKELQQPFKTGHDINPGTGLGLSLVVDIARLHGGKLLIKNKSASKQGKTMILEIPLSDQITAKAIQ